MLTVRMRSHQGVQHDVDTTSTNSVFEEYTVQPTETAIIRVTP